MARIFRIPFPDPDNLCGDRWIDCLEFAFGVIENQNEAIVQTDFHRSRQRTRRLQCPQEFGAPLTGLTSEDFSEPGYFYQMGNPPLRVDVMMEIPGGDFNEAWNRRNTVSIGDDQIHFISREDLISVKLASGSDQDLKDVEAIKKNS